MRELLSPSKIKRRVLSRNGVPIPTSKNTHRSTRVPAIHTPDKSSVDYSDVLPKGPGLRDPKHSWVPAGYIRL